MKKKLLIITLVLAMLLSLAAGCAGEQEPAAESQQIQQSEPAPAEDSPDAEEPAEAPQGEAEGEAEEPVAAEKPAEYTLPLNQSPVDITIFYPSRSGGHAQKSLGENVFWSRLEENLGYSINWIEPYQSTATEQFNLTIAAGEYPHIVFESMLAMSGSAYTGGYDLAVEEEVYMDLTPYLEDYAPHYNYLLQDPTIYNDIVTESGLIVPFATIYEEPSKTGLGPVINKDYWEATGLELPTTVDQWYELGLAMKANGVEAPLAVSAEGSIVEGLIGNAMGASIAGTFLVENATGELVFDATTQQSKEYIELFRQWYSDGILDREFISITEMSFADYNNGRIGTSSGMGFMLDSYYDMYGIRQQALPVVHGDGLDEKMVLLASAPASKVNSMPGIALCTSCDTDELIKACMNLCDFFYSDAGYVAANYGWIEGETYDIIDGKYIANEFFSERDDNLGAHKSYYTGDGDFGYVYPNFNFDSGSETLIAASELWTVPAEQPHALYTNLPGNMKLNASESEDVSSKLTDLQTYVESTVLSWLVLESDFNDAAWDDYVATCQSLDVEGIKDIYTGAYQRYIGQ